MTQYGHWKEALLQARSQQEIEAIVGQCRDSLAAGDKVGWSVAARNALFEPDLQAAAIALEREEARFEKVPESAATVRGVAQVFRAAASRLAQLG